MALKINDRAFLRDVVGMPSTHATKFLEVSRTTGCIILCRATGPTCLQLLKQNYDTKGFRVHAKSCDWRPMAGFVLRDPRLNKYGYDPLNPKKANYNQKEHAESETDRKSGAGWRSSTTPLKIYSERVDWPVRKGIIQVAARASHLNDSVAAGLNRAGNFAWKGGSRRGESPGERVREGSQGRRQREGSIAGATPKIGSVAVPRHNDRT